MISERLELVTGVNPLLYRQSNHDLVLISRELSVKELTGKYAGQWGLGYETVEGLESHRDTVNRYFNEELRIIAGKVSIPDDLESSKLCTVRISPPEMAAWVHSYPCPVSDDFEVEVGSFKDEIEGVMWASRNKLLSLKGTSLEVILRPGTYEILEQQRVYTCGLSRITVEDYTDPANLPNWDFYRLVEKGFSQDEALCQLGIDSRLLRESRDLIRSL